MNGSMRSARYHWAWLTITLTVVAAGFGAATTEAQVVSSDRCVLAMEP
jgi:hypothetical protein